MRAYGLAMSCHVTICNSIPNFPVLDIDQVDSVNGMIITVAIRTVAIYIYSLPFYLLLVQ